MSRKNKKSEAVRINKDNLIKQTKKLEAEMCRSRKDNGRRGGYRK